ncbi:hypothetical protein PR048_013509 [Dryococelus australis]|uniref:Uncharacterized protein n=1 Tax=Dryococelus australis TaxID=614101 RepID=A0ABQ9HSD6_9NEOP|nr:hypothetical protein PR048_013509 [Dryococelus australis]
MKEAMTARNMLQLQITFENFFTGHKNKERDINQLSQLNRFFNKAATSASKMLAGELSFINHTVKHSLSYK